MFSEIQTIFSKIHWYINTTSYNKRTVTNRIEKPIARNNKSLIQLATTTMQHLQLSSPNICNLGKQIFTGFTAASTMNFNNIVFCQKSQRCPLSHLIHFKTTAKINVYMHKQSYPYKSFHQYLIDRFKHKLLTEQYTHKYQTSQTNKIKEMQSPKSPHHHIQQVSCIPVCEKEKTGACHQAEPSSLITKAAQKNSNRDAKYANTVRQSCKNIEQCR